MYVKSIIFEIYIFGEKNTKEFLSTIFEIIVGYIGFDLIILMLMKLRVDFTLSHLKTQILVRFEATNNVAHFILQ